ncbi:alpha/beta hydrolase family esterase [Corynebacterium atypicum]|uniref:alpha/beta hydrolase family esterase n=1 Tax=Corynebacterium atypicum TaxID=191610 RepID=UPI000689F321|nr:PHB depolymerase family esterase [Corynebacterium atypicum]
MAVAKLEITHDARVRTARVVVPETAVDRPPLLVFYHGSKQSSSVIRAFTGRSFDRLAQRLGAVIVYPDGIGRHFNDARALLPEETRRLGVDDVGFTHALIHAVADRFGADPTRVAGLGFSNGGHMAMRMLRDAPSTFAAAVIFAATWPAPGHEVARQPGAAAWQPTPMLFMHGTADPLAPYQGGLVGFGADHSRGEGLSAPQTAELFAGWNNAAGQPRLTEPAPGVERAAWAARPGASSAPVELWTLLDTGHVIPCGVEQPTTFLGPGTDAIDAAEVTEGFLRRVGFAG